MCYLQKTCYWKLFLINTINRSSETKREIPGEHGVGRVLDSYDDGDINNHIFGPEVAPGIWSSLTHRELLSSQS